MAPRSNRYGERNSRPLKRARAHQDSQPVIWIYCEGAVTEPTYFKAIRAMLGRNINAKIEVEFAVGGSPLHMLRHALKHSGRTSNNGRFKEGDSLWLVFDIESPQRHPHIDEAIRLARRHGVNLAASNPCFELWLNLHHSDHFAELTNKDAKRRFQDLPDCHTAAGFAQDYHPSYQLAKHRAQTMARDPWLAGSNPATNVWELVDVLLGLRQCGLDQTHNQLDQRR